MSTTTPTIMRPDIEVVFIQARRLVDASYFEYGGTLFSIDRVFYSEATDTVVVYAYSMRSGDRHRLPDFAGEWRIAVPKHLGGVPS